MNSSAIKFGSQRYPVAVPSGRSRLRRLKFREGVKDNLPRTLVIIPVLLLLIRISLFAKGYAENGFGYIDSYAMVEIVLVGATLLLLLRDKATEPVLRTVSQTPVRWLLLYYVFATLSALWS